MSFDEFMHYIWSLKKIMNVKDLYVGTVIVLEPIESYDHDQKDMVISTYRSVLFKVKNRFLDLESYHFLEEFHKGSTHKYFYDPNYLVPFSSFTEEREFTKNDAFSLLKIKKEEIKHLERMKN